MLINQYAHGLAGKAPPRPLPLRSISRFAVFRSSNAIAHRTTNNEQPTVPHRTVHRGAEATGEGREGRRGGSLCCPPSPSLSLSLAPATTIISASGRTIARPPTISISLPNTFDTEANPNTERGERYKAPANRSQFISPSFVVWEGGGGNKVARFPSSSSSSSIDVRFTLSPRVGQERRPRISLSRHGTIPDRSSLIASLFARKGERERERERRANRISLLSVDYNSEIERLQIVQNIGNR